MDRVMKRIWVSPWSRLFMAVLCVLGATANRHGVFYWIDIAGGVAWVAAFWNAGNERWGR